MAGVEQIKAKRFGVGLKGRDAALSCPGLTLFAPTAGDGTVYLADLGGEVVHRWSMPYAPGLYGRLTEGGTLFYNGRVRDDPRSAISGASWKGGAVLEADREGRVLWEVRHPDHHHDAALLRNGNVLLLCAARVPVEFAREVEGGTTGGEGKEGMLADYLVEVTRDGEVVWKWKSWERLDPKEHPIVAPQESRAAWTHANSVAETPDGDVAVSFRNTSTAVVVDRRSGEVIRGFGPPLLAQQHAAEPLANGNLLVFDNGRFRTDHPLPHSRVLEVEPGSGEVVWSYRERDPADFFSPYMGNAQRLPNGNTLICEGYFGRIFEVTRDGEVVWEYVSPYFHKPVERPDARASNALFRAYRFDEAAAP